MLACFVKSKAACDDIEELAPLPAKINLIITIC